MAASMSRNALCNIKLISRQRRHVLNCSWQIYRSLISGSPRRPLVNAVILGKHKRFSSKIHLAQGGSGVLFSGVLAWLGLEGEDNKDQEVKEDIVLATLSPIQSIDFFVYEGNNLRDSKNYGDADLKYHAALRLAAKLHSNKKITDEEYAKAQALVFDAMSDLALMKQEFEEADKLLKHAMKGLVQSGAEKTGNAITEMGIKAGCICMMLGKNAEARLVFESCIENQEEKLRVLNMGGQLDEEMVAQTEGLLGMALERYGKFLMEEREFAKARKVLQRSDEIAVKLLGEDHLQRLTLLGDIAATYVFERDFEKSEELLKDLIAKAKTKGDNLLLAVLRCNLGSSLLRQNKFGEAKLECEKAMNLASKTSDAEHAYHQALLCIEKAKEEKGKFQSSLARPSESVGSGKSWWKFW